MKEIERIESTSDYNVQTGILIEYTTYFYSDGTWHTETRIVDTHQPGWSSNAD